MAIELEVAGPDCDRCHIEYNPVARIRTDELGTVWLCRRCVMEAARAFERVHASTIEQEKLAECADLLVNLAQIIDVVKQEWAESWSDWDQKQRNGITKYLAWWYEHDEAKRVQTSDDEAKEASNDR